MQDGRFPPTRWTLIERAADSTAEDAEEALGELLERYLPALRAHLVHAMRVHPDQADDLVQGFVADKILRGDLIARARRDRGKFRTLMLTSLNRYAISEFRRISTARRAPTGGSPIPLDSLTQEANAALAIPAASTDFDLAWIREIVDETLRRVEHDCRSSGRVHYWVLFQKRVVQPILEGAQPEPYAEMVVRLGFLSPVQAANALFTVKRMFERSFRSVVWEYTGSEPDVDEEIRELRAILAEVSAYTQQNDHVTKPPGTD